jgi:hypothetical protein
MAPVEAVEGVGAESKGGIGQAGEERLVAAAQGREQVSAVEARERRLDLVGGAGDEGDPDKVVAGGGADTVDEREQVMGAEAIDLFGGVLDDGAVAG